MLTHYFLAKTSFQSGDDARFILSMVGKGKRGRAIGDEEERL